MNVRDLLLILAQNAIKGTCISTEAVAALNREKMATLFKVAKKHDVAHLVCYALEQNGFCFEGEAWQLFLKEKEQAKLRYEMMQADINEICSCFDSEGIEYILLKGAVVRSYYPEPWMRTSCDIDILIHDKDLNRAIEALTKNYSYTTDGKITYHDVSLYSPFGMHLELHHNIKENIDKYDEVLINVWDFSSRICESTYRCVQSNEFLMFHLTAHMAYHFIGGGCGLRSVLDMWLLKHKLMINDEKLNILLKKVELDKFYGVIMDLGEYWFGESKKANETILETEKYILLGGVYGTSKQGAVSKQINEGGKFKYLLSRIFMPYENLMILYPIIKKHKVLTPFCQIIRWFTAVFKYKKISKEIKNVTSVSKEQSESIGHLLKELNL